MLQLPWSIFTIFPRYKYFIISYISLLELWEVISLIYDFERAYFPDILILEVSWERFIEQYFKRDYEVQFNVCGPL